MKPRLPYPRNQAWSLVEVLLVILVLAVLVALLLRPVYLANHQRALRIGCENNLRQIGHAYGFWENYESTQCVMLTLVTNNAGNAWIDFNAMSNVVKNPNAFHCPADTNTTGKISYFVNLDLNKRDPQMVIFGDDNFTVDNVPIKSGIFEITSNTPLDFSDARHHLTEGLFAFGDGGVHPVGGMLCLQWKFQECGLATNRLAIP
ncbi:MAG TPA: hypothetical protein VMH87_18205 [Pseudomonadales bacterium]|nr:hypothetical protein [Pseudomonadales bacterium]